MNPPGSQQGMQTPANIALQQLLPQLIAAVQQATAAPPGFPVPAPVSGRYNFGAEQAQLGVRVNEFHSLSVMAPFVRPAPAIKLQALWDRGNR